MVCIEEKLSLDFWVLIFFPGPGTFDAGYYGAGLVSVSCRHG